MIGVLGIASVPKDLYTVYDKVYLLQSFVRGFQYYDGPSILETLNTNHLLELIREPKNKYDANAIALSYEGKKIGYVPKENNEMLSVLMDTGLLDLQAEISHIKSDAATWENVHFVLYALKPKTSLDKPLGEKYSTLKTPTYYTLSTKKESIHIKESERSLGLDFYEELVKHSENDRVYDLIHNNFFLPESFEYAFQEEKIRVDRKSIEALSRETKELLKELWQDLDSLPETVEEYLFIPAAIVCTIPDSIEKFEQKVEKLTGEEIYTIVWRKTKNAK